LQINAEDAEVLRPQRRRPREVSSRSGSFVAATKLSDKVDRGMVFVPTNFPDQSVYRLFDENTTVCRVKLTAMGAAIEQ
jgi:formylmethanofuran dehydrogenase subunit D